MLALVGACDALMLGKLNQDSMAAVSLATQVTFVFNLFMAAFIIGVSCITAAIFMAAAMIFPEDIMRFFTNEPELVLLGSGYLRMVGVSWILSAVSQVYINL
mgnify:CR=1 FL=1